MNDFQVYPVTVPANRTIEEMVEAGKYTWADSYITSERFPDIGPTGEYELVLLHFNRVVRIETVIAKMSKLGLTPAFIGMLLAFGKKYPEIPREFRIMALSSVCVSSYGSRCSPYLRGLGGFLDLCLLVHRDYRWYKNSRCRFLAFRKVG